MSTATTPRARRPWPRSRCRAAPSRASRRSTSSAGLTEVPDRRVVFRGVDWAFYERLVDSIPEASNIHVDYDGKDLEVMAKGRRHERINRRLDHLVVIIADEWDIPFTGLSEMTWKRPAISRGLESDNAYYFLPEKLAQDAAASERGSDEIDDYPNPDLGARGRHIPTRCRPPGDLCGAPCRRGLAVRRWPDHHRAADSRWGVRGRRFQRIPAHPCRGIAAPGPGGTGR